MEKLNETFEKIITEYTKAYDNDDPTAGGWAISALIKAVKERDAFIIGEDVKANLGNKSKNEIVDLAINGIKEDQRQRAEESR